MSDITVSHDEFLRETRLLRDALEIRTKELAEAIKERDSARDWNSKLIGKLAAKHVNAKLEQDLVFQSLKTQLYQWRECADKLVEAMNSGFPARRIEARKVYQRLKSQQ